MKNMIVTIETMYSTAEIFAEIDENHALDLQVEKILETVGFCDDWAIVEVEEVNAEYVQKRKQAFAEFMRKYGQNAVHELPFGQYSTLKRIQCEMIWRKNNAEIW